MQAVICIISTYNAFSGSAGVILSLSLSPHHIQESCFQRSEVNILASHSHFEILSKIDLCKVALAYKSLVGSSSSSSRQGIYWSTACTFNCTSGTTSSYTSSLLPVTFPVLLPVTLPILLPDTVLVPLLLTLPVLLLVVLPVLHPVAIPVLLLVAHPPWLLVTELQNYHIPVLGFIAFCSFCLCETGCLEDRSFPQESSSMHRFSVHRQVFSLFLQELKSCAVEVKICEPNLIQMRKSDPLCLP